MNTSIIGKSIAQGDVLLIPISSLPNNLKPMERKKGDLILAYGEVTGHVHRFAEPETAVQGFVDENDAIFLDVKAVIEEAKLLHGKQDGTQTPGDKPHDPLSVKPGFYKVIAGQREFVSQKGITRKSID